MLRSLPSRISAAVILLLLVLMGAPSAVAQTDVGDICPVGTCEPAQGGLPGTAGSGTNLRDGSDGADVSSNGSGGAGTGSSTSGQSGTSQAGRAGQSGRPTPPAPPPAPRTSTSSTRRTATTTNRSTSSGAAATPIPEDLLSPSPSPSPTPSPTPSVSPTPSPTPSDLVAALDDADPTANDGSLVPFFAILAGAILLFVYVRGRRANRRGMHSVSSRRGGSHSF